MAYELGEIISLIIIGLGFFFVMHAYMKNKHLRLFFLAYAALTAGAILTVIEDAVMPEVSDLLEHLFGSALAGMLFFATAYLGHKKLASIKAGVTRQVR